MEQNGNFLKWSFQIIVPFLTTAQFHSSKLFRNLSSSNHRGYPHPLIKTQSFFQYVRFLLDEIFVVPCGRNRIGVSTHSSAPRFPND